MKKCIQGVPKKIVSVSAHGQAWMQENPPRGNMWDDELYKIGTAEEKFVTDAILRS